MNSPRLPKVAGINSKVPSPAHTAQPSDEPPAAEGSVSSEAAGTSAPPAPVEALQDRLAGWVSDLTTLHEFTESLTRTATLDSALHEILRAGAQLVGARRALVVVEPGDGTETSVGLGLGRADLGHIETVPRSATPYGRLLDTPAGQPGGEREIAHPDLLSEDDLDPRHREVAARLGYAASYALPLATESAGRVGAAVWLYDEPAEPSPRQRHLVGLYARHATEHLARLLELERARTTAATLATELLPPRLPRIASVQLAVRHRTCPRGGGDWYDALPLPEGALGLAVGSVTGSGPSAVAAMGRLRASLRAYAVLEGEDPVAVLSDLELLLRLTEPARSATALFAHCEPALRRLTLAGAGHSPPLIVGSRRTEYVETSLSAPLGMLACWEAPSVEVSTEPGETLLLYTDGLLRRTGESMDRAFAKLHAAASGAARAVREDPDALVDHVLRTLLPDGGDLAESEEDIVLLAARFA